MKKLNELSLYINKFKLDKILLLLIFIFIILRLPSLFEPTWYGDEGIYAAVGNGVSQGQLLYQDVWDNKPPAIYYIYALSLKVFGPNQFYIRLLALLFGILAVVFFYKSFKLLFKRKPLIPTLIFILFFGTTFIEGNIANAENFFIPLNLIGLYCALKYLKLKNYIYLILFGLSFGLAFLFKIHPIFEFIPIFIYLYLESHKIKKFREIFRIKYIVSKIFILPILYFLLPIVIYLIISTIQGNIGDFLQMFFTQSKTYINYSSHNDVGFIIFANTVLIRIITLLLLTIALVLYFLKSQSKVLLVVLLFFYACFAALLSGRPYGHYLLQIVYPAILLLYLFLDLSQKGTFFNKLNSMIYYFLIIVFILNLFFHGENLTYSYVNPNNYYPNFLAYATGRVSNNDYNNSFDNKVNGLNELVNSTKFLKGKTVYLLDDQPWFYALSQTRNIMKYVTMYHLQQENIDINTFASALKNNEYIITNNTLTETYKDPIKKVLLNNYAVQCSGGSNYLIYKKK